ncbi:MAG TPA: hypothetical protein VM532_15695 [Burkholderiales bacterium]|nr:hypothetical protein [Burkholderiales bacterium]
MKQLERLLFLQGNRCFFCLREIQAGEASVEHLVAISNGGSKDDENCVVCCKAINVALGNLSIKAKFQAIVNHRGAVTCPMASLAEPLATSETQPQHQESDRIALVVAKLLKLGPNKPRRVSTLKNTMNSVFQKQLSKQELASLLTALESMGYVTAQETKITYALPTQDT